MINLASYFTPQSTEKSIKISFVYSVYIITFLFVHAYFACLFVEFFFFLFSLSTFFFSSSSYVKYLKLMKSILFVVFLKKLNLYLCWQDVWYFSWSKWIYGSYYARVRSERIWDRLLFPLFVFCPALSLSLNMQMSSIHSHLNNMDRRMLLLSLLGFCFVLSLNLQK